MTAVPILREAPILVTGGAGFIGANLVDRLAAEGNDVVVYDALTRTGVEANLAWLRRRHPQRVSSIVADVRDRAALDEAAGRARAVFHLAAQVAVTTSLVTPEEDFAVNVQATFHLLEALRRQPKPPPLIFASTNKVYGNLADIAIVQHGEAWMPADAGLRDHGIGEDRALSFYTPYGCSKGAADQYVLDYARSFGVPTCVFRMSCIYGPRQMGTEDQGWLAHFLFAVMQGRPISIFGDGRQVRDVLYVEDAVAAYIAAWRRIGEVAGQAFNLGGGPDNAVTLRQVLAEIGAITGRVPDLHFSEWRPGDQRYFVADARRARAALDLPRPVPWREGLGRLALWAMAERGAPQPARAAGARG